jgi:hypothetical protein
MLIHEVIRHLEQLKREDIEALPPVERRRLADLLRHLAELAAKGEPPKGVLGDLANGDRDG